MRRPSVRADSGSRNPWKIERSSNKDILHSFRVLYRWCEGCERHNGVSQFHRFISKLGNVQSSDHRTLSTKRFLSNINQNHESQGHNRQIVSCLDPCLEFKLCTAGILYTKARFLWIVICRFDDLIENLFPALSWTFQVFFFQENIDRKSICTDAEWKKYSDLSWASYNSFLFESLSNNTNF